MEHAEPLISTEKRPKTSVLQFTAKMLPVVAIVVIVDHFCHNILCDALFGCGCVYGSDADCNVWNPDGPRCPYCLANATVGFATTLVIPITAAVVGAATVVIKLPTARYPLVALTALITAISSYLLAYIIVASVFFATMPDYGYFAGVGKTPPHRLAP